MRGTWSARSHLPALRAGRDVELTAICTTRSDSAEAARPAWGARLAFDDWRRMIASPDNVLTGGMLANRAVASVHVGAIRFGKDFAGSSGPDTASGTIY